MLNPFQVELGCLIDIVDLLLLRPPQGLANNLDFHVPLPFNLINLADALLTDVLEPLHRRIDGEGVTSHHVARVCNQRRRAVVRITKLLLHHARR